MTPKKISLEEIPSVISDKFKHKDIITIYVGSNSATPTASITSLTEGIKAENLRLPFIRMVHILMQGPIPYIEKGLQDKVMTYSIFSGKEVRQAANEGRAFYLPCTLANIDSLIGKGREYEPDVVIIKICQSEHTGEYSLGLSVEALFTAIDNAKLVIAELDNSMPFTQGQSIVGPSAIDFLVVDENIKPVYDLPAPDFDNLLPEETRIGELITENFIHNGVTLQVGIGKIPDAVVGTIKNSNFKDLGIQTELYGDGLMYLQREGIVTNRKKKVDPEYTTTSLILGSKKLYDYVHLRSAIQMRSCSYTNSAEIIRKNAPYISINTSMGVDLFGNIWADFIDTKHYYSGVGGQPDFVRALNDPEYGTPIIALKSITKKGRSKIVKEHPSGVNLTASAYDGVVVVTENGIADLRGLTIGEKALAIATICHPDYREEMIRYVYDDPIFTKLSAALSSKIPKGVIVKEKTKWRNLSHTAD